MRHVIGLFGLLCIAVCAMASGRAAAADAEWRYLVTNQGVDLKDRAEIRFLRPGQHDGPVIASTHSGLAARIPEGPYDVQIVFSDGAAHKTLWFDNQPIGGKGETAVEMALPMAEVRYVLTNDGVDVRDNGEVHFVPVGHRDEASIEWGRSGSRIRLPAGQYDVHVTFTAGTIRKDFWLDNQTLAGTVEKLVEIGLALARVRYVISNGGSDVGDKGQVHYFPRGRHEGPRITWAASGGTASLPEGTYNVLLTYRNGLIAKSVWLDNQSFTGAVEKVLEMAVDIAEPLVTVTRDGADVGDIATVGFIDPVRHTEIGAIAAGHATPLPAGTYDIRARLFGAEGWARGISLRGSPRLTIDIRPVRIDTLRAGGEGPWACIIEIPDLEFDLEKGMPKAGAEATLRRVLALFTNDRTYAAEIGGHTSQTGQAPFSLTVSDAWAAGLKNWLIAHGVAAQRVTAHGYGALYPLVPNTTDLNRQKNRRLELRAAECR